MLHRPPLRLQISLVAVALAVAATLHAMPLEPKLQAALLTKIIAYDSSLAASQPGTPPRVLVVYKNASAGVKNLLDALRDAGIDAFAVSEQTVEEEIMNARLLYLMPDVDADALSELSARAGTLSVSGTAGFAEAGKIAVGFGLGDEGRPQIVVNLTQVQREGHRFAPQFLSLTRIVR